MTYGNGKTFTGTYNTDYNPTSFTVSSLYSATYSTDPANNIIQLGSSNYGYDALLRMSSESGTIYSFDSASNRTLKGGTATVMFASSKPHQYLGWNHADLRLKRQYSHLCIFRL